MMNHYLPVEKKVPQISFFLFTVQSLIRTRYSVLYSVKI